MEATTRTTDAPASAPGRRGVPWVRVGAYAGFAVLALFAGYFAIYAKFAPYDDEGYILLSIRQFVSTGHLYDQVYTQYGPFPYELWGGLFAVTGRTLTPNIARVLVLGEWLVLALLAGAVVERLTSRVSLGVTAAIVAFSTAGSIINEPLHPGGLAAVLLMAVAAAGVLLDARPRLQMGLIGALLSATVLTKVNVGGAAVVAVALALSVSAPALAARRRLAPVLVGLAVLLPLVLTLKDLRSAWAENLAVLIALGTAAIGIAACGARRPLPDPARDARTLGALVAGVAGAGVLIIVAVLATGTGAADLVRGVLIEPLGQRDAFTIAADIPQLSIDLAAAGVVAAIVLSRSAGALGAVSAWLRIAAALLIWLLASSTLPIVPSPAPGPLSAGVALAWIAALPPRGLAPAGPSAFARILLPALAVLGALAIYPVAGSQVGFAAALLVPTGGLILADGLHELDAVGGRVLGPTALTGVLGSALAAVLAYQVLVQPGVTGASSYQALKPLPFGGATRMRQSVETSDAFAQIVNGIRTRCDTFATLPGMNSFYLWAQRTPPTGLNATSWMYLLDDAQQQRVVDAIRPVRRLCVVRNESLLAGWTTPTRPLPQRPLLRYLQSGFKPVVDAGGYQLMVRG